MRKQLIPTKARYHLYLTECIKMYKQFLNLLYFPMERWQVVWSQAKRFYECVYCLRQPTKPGVESRVRMTSSLKPPALMLFIQIRICCACTLKCVLFFSFAVEKKKFCMAFWVIYIYTFFFTKTWLPPCGARPPLRQKTWKTKKKRRKKELTTHTLVHTHICSYTP